MDIVLSIAAFLLTLLGIVGCVVPMLPGPLIGYAGLLCAGFASYSPLGKGALLLWLAAVIAVSLADYLLPAWMTRRFGGSRAGAIGATVGVFAGFLLFPPAGIVLGPFFGAVIGELLHDGRDSARAFRVGFGSFLAFVVGTGAKLVVCIWMFVRIVADAWPALRDWFAMIFQTQ